MPAAVAEGSTSLPVRSIDFRLCEFSSLEPRDFLALISAIVCLSENHTVIGVDNLSTGFAENIAHLAGDPRFRFEERDICASFDPGPVDYVFNMASPASPPEYLRLGIETLRVGSVGVENTLQIAARYGAGYLHASTSECYGDPLEHPQAESYWGNVNPVGPRSVYDEAKRFGEAMVMAYHRSRGVNTHLVRIFNTYGPRLHPGDGRVISNFMMQALRGEPLTIYGDGSQTRSFCYVDDLIEGIVRLSRSEEHLPVNLGNPEELTILDCAQAVLEATGSKSELSFVEPAGGRSYAPAPRHYEGAHPAGLGAAHAAPGRAEQVAGVFQEQSNRGRECEPTLARRLVGLDAQKIGEDVALLGRELALVAGGIQHGRALIEGHRTQILKGALDDLLALGRQTHQLATGVTHLHLLLRRQALKHFTARQAAVTLRRGHLVELVQLLHEPLLGLGSQAVEAGVVMKQALLVLERKPLVLIKPGA